MVRRRRRTNWVAGDLDANGLADVWRYEILPFLAEHHYGDGVDLEARYGLAAPRRQVTPAVAAGAEGADIAGRVAEADQLTLVRVSAWIRAVTSVSRRR